MNPLPGMNAMRDRRSTAGAPRVLVVDDNVDHCRTVGELVRALGYDVTCSSDSSEAFSLLLHQPFEAVLVDIVMPGFSGTDLFHALRASPYNDHVPAIAVSAYEEHRQAAEERGFSAFLPKPLDSETLKLTLERALSS
jgi:CheY-like chemotaxis protein